MTDNLISTLDIDECEEESDMCSGDADCHDTIGSYDCICRSGYTGDGIECRGTFH